MKPTKNSQRVQKGLPTKHDRDNKETRLKHSEDYSNSTYRHVKSGGLTGGGAGKGDADRTGNRKAFRENYEEIFEK
jgi:hypothetical protein